MKSKPNPEPALPDVLSDRQATDRRLRWTVFAYEHFQNPVLWFFMGMAAAASVLVIHLASPDDRVVAAACAFPILASALLLYAECNPVLAGIGELDVLDAKFLEHMEWLADNDDAVAGWLAAAKRERKTLRGRDYGAALDHYQWLLDSQGQSYGEGLSCMAMPRSNRKRMPSQTPELA